MLDIQGFFILSTMLVARAYKKLSKFFMGRMVMGQWDEGAIVCGTMGLWHGGTIRLLKQRELLVFRMIMT
jgi:hypothetical protein